jgi:hypothetical protein
VLRPRPAGDTPAGRAFLHCNGEERADFLNWRAVFLEFVIGGDDHIGAIAGEVDVSWSAESDYAVDDAVLFCVGVVGIGPLCAGAGTMPLEERNSSRMAATALTSPLLKLSTNWRTVAMASVLSVAIAGRPV